MTRRSHRAVSNVVTVLLVVVMLLVAAAAAGAIYVKQSFDAIPRFEGGAMPPSDPEPAEEPAEEPVSTEPETFLVFSTGSEGVEESEGERLGVGGPRAGMSDGLTDTLMLVAVNPATGRAAVLGIPRDLWVSDYSSKINALYNSYGVDVLTKEVEDVTGVEVDHQVAVNFTAFADLTDAIGGVSLDFPLPVRDDKAHLDVPEAGCQQLDGAQALALVRSRHWEVYSGGRWGPDETSSDFGRIDRQQIFLSAALDKLLTPSLPARVPELLGVAQDNIILDQDLGVRESVDLARALRGISAGSVEMDQLPGEVGFVEQASVVFLDEAGAQDVLDSFLSVLEPGSGDATSDTSAGPAASSTVEPTTGAPDPAAAVRPSSTLPAAPGSGAEEPTSSQPVPC